MPKRKDSGLRARWPVGQHSAMLSAVFWLPNKKKIWKHTVRISCALRRLLGSLGAQAAEEALFWGLGFTFLGGPNYNERGLCWGPPILGNYHLQERACAGCFCGCFPNMNYPPFKVRSPKVPHLPKKVWI